MTTGKYEYADALAVLNRNRRTIPPHFALAWDNPQINGLTDFFGNGADCLKITGRSSRKNRLQ